MKMLRCFRHSLFTLVTATIIALMASVPPAMAVPLKLGDVPLPLLTSVEPNIVLSFDDSGSMEWAYLPDGVSGRSGNARGCSNQINRIYYNPATNYQPPVRHDSTPLNATATSFTAAYVNGFNTGSGAIDLSGPNYRPSWDGLTSYGNCGQTTPTYPFYFVYDTTLGSCTTPSINSDNCYRRVNVSASSGPGGTDERQNFANWYSYYRNRNMLAKTAAGQAFSRIGTGVRLVGQHINNTTTSAGTPRFTQTIPLMKKFCENPSATPDVDGCPGNSTARSDFFARLYNAPHDGYTPLRPTMQRAGDYYMTADPYRDIPGSSGPELTCRQNFHVLFTDGYWNSDAATGNANRNNDGSAITSLPDGTAFSTTARPPYNDTYTGTLADVAFYYWATDLRSSSTNNVPTHYADNSGSATENYWNPVNDPATWQHMVNYTIGLGIDGTLPFNTTTYNQLRKITTPFLNWPDPISNTQGQRIDDLWHAAINSRGQYFSASESATLSESLSNIINDIGARTGSAAGLAANSGSLSTSTQIFQARYQTGGWAGQLFSFGVNTTTGTINATPTWDAAEKLRTQDWDTGRRILTFDPTTSQGAAFRWSSLNTTQQGFLNTSPVTLLSDGQGDKRLEYLRGSSEHEGTGNFYRKRVCYSGSTVVTCPSNMGWLGDIAHSAPVFVGSPPFLYPDNLETGTNKDYSAFRTTHQSRKPMVYVGANDGMAHGFDASTDSSQGTELLAYVPNEVMPRLNHLTSAASAHRFYVDGTPTAGDVFITPRGASEPEWRTVLVGGLRNGGKAYYALDITDPSSFSEAASAPNSTVLWEFTDPDLGFTYSRPIISKMANGKWAAIFGNGYNNSGTGTAVLYIVFIEDGIDGWSSGDFIKIDTGIGAIGTPNGLATPAVVDLDQDFRTDFIYAGDLQGNLWRFDVSSNNPVDWRSVSNRLNLFTATTSGNVPQAITTRPSVALHPAGLGGVVLYFGTGKYLEIGDNTTSGTPTQTFYAVWDKLNSTTVQRSDLLTQTLSTTTVAGVTVRVVSDDAITWRTSIPGTSEHMGWLIDLPTTGERIIAENILLPGRVMVASYIPTEQPCTPGGSGWLMQFDVNNGGRLPSTFDVDGNGSLDTSDMANIGGVDVAATGISITGGGLGSPIVLAGPAVPDSGKPPGSFSCQQVACTTSATGTMSCAKVPCSKSAWREGWQQLK